MIRLLVFLCNYLLFSNFCLFSQTQIGFVNNQIIKVYQIFGVSSSEDIGGVECNPLFPQNENELQTLKFTNSNDFNVSVLYRVEIMDNGGKTSFKSGTISLERGETKTIPLKFHTLGDIRLITRKMGTIAGPIRNDSEELRIISGYLIPYPQTINLEGRANVSELINNLNIKRVYNRTNWRIPSDAELNMMGIDNSECLYYSIDNWNRFNIHPFMIIPVSDK